MDENAEENRGVDIEPSPWIFELNDLDTKVFVRLYKQHHHREPTEGELDDFIKEWVEGGANQVVEDYLVSGYQEHMEWRKLKEQIELEEEEGEDEDAVE